MNPAFEFDPATNAFVPTMALINVPRRGHTATLMPNGQVLIAGGYNANTYALGGGTLPFCEVYDPALSKRDPERKLSCHFTGIGHLGVRLRCSVFDWTTYLFRSFDLPSILLPA